MTIALAAPAGLRAAHRGAVRASSPRSPSDAGADVRDELDGASASTTTSTAAARRARRRVRSLERLAAPGLHLIAEIKRRSPSAGGSPPPDEDIVARARAYEAGGAAAISVLCEPHWFGGSVDDLRAVRAAVSIPVLAKEFVVEADQLADAAGGRRRPRAAARRPPSGEAPRRASSSGALELGLEPLVEAHDERELERALATDARLIGLNNRDLRTLDVDPERAVRLRELVPDDRLVIAESGVRDAATVARWRALGFDAALVGEALDALGRPGAARPRVRRRRAGHPAIRRTSRAVRSSRSAASPTRTASSPRSAPVPTRSG